jgi:DNA-directed RNA polymerase subunit M/transcription elongation factor TFIIS
MPRTTTIHHGVFQMALVGFEMQRNRIDAAISEIEAQLGIGGTRHFTATATDSSEPKTTGRKRFSIAARKRMAAAQKKRWAELKAKKAEAAKPKSKPAAKRNKVAVTAPSKQRHVQVKAAKKIATKVVKAAAKPKPRKTTPRPKNIAAKPPKTAAETPATSVQVAAEPATS